MKQTDAIVMALGSDLSGDLAPYASLGRKCLIPLNGQPAISYLVRNLKACDAVSRVVVVTDQPEFDCAPQTDACIDAGGDTKQCVLAGLLAVANSERSLILNGDMPLASPEALGDLLKCAPEADVVYPIVEKSDVCEVFPRRECYYVNAREGQFTGSSCMLFNPQAVLSREEMLARLLNALHNPQELIGIVGMGFAMKMMLARLSISEFEAHLSKSLDLSCRVFVTHFPELLVSIDKQADIGMMERELRI